MALCLNFFDWRWESHRFGQSLHSTKIFVDSLIIAALADREVTVYSQEKLSFLTWSHLLNLTSYRRRQLLYRKRKLS